MAAMAEVGAPSSLLFNNHDLVRSGDRFDLGLLNVDKSTLHRQGDAKKFNLERGTRRARAGALLMLALPGGAYVYQGEELALPEVRDIPEDRLTDPRWVMSGKVDRGRDGCRVPLPWHHEPTGDGTVDAWSMGTWGWGESGRRGVSCEDRGVLSEQDRAPVFPTSFEGGHQRADDRGARV